jgi:Na+-transporting NADH:ubiquinone oxidoreductase subunit C
MNEKVKMIVFVLVLGSVLTTALVSVNALTKPLVDKNRERKLHKSVLDAFGIEFTKDRIDQVFEANVETRTRDDKDFYVTRNGEVAFVISGSGVWGPIEGAFAVMPDLKTIKGITIIHQKETPGLGGRIAEAEFLDRFKNKKILPELLILPPGKASGENQVDGITGATLSCKAFEEILNTEAKKYLALYEEK